MARLVPFVLAPFIIFQNKTSKKGISMFVKAFIIGNLILLLALDFIAIYDMLMANSVFVELGKHKYYRFLYTRYTMGDYFSHIYLSAYTLLTLVLVHQFNFFRKRIKWILTLYLLIHLFMMGSRAVVISIILASFLFLLIASMLKAKFFRYLLLLLLGLTLLSTAAYMFKDTIFFNRYSQIFEWYGKRDKVLERNYSINKRIKIYIIGSSFFKTKSFEIDGTGIVDSQIEKRYNERFKNEFNFKTETYNAHNQYIHNFIDWGYLGILVLLFLLFLLVKDATKKRYLWVLFFWLFFAILLSMESFLIRQRGIMLFIIFGSLFMSKDNLISTIKNEG
ncbi:O-antigen ligase family protein [Allomuricauda sp. SCSIO 65647]|uniref:O-antigen ligase family protein n=1 Tax=Allomuricauda sp. SCSIO 65647 TaxID=2908843 RepID=UPI001F3D6F69|nr:O-antigen ligase family protein [Muricauda sp. SCSIO 65647]UJH69041.1 O-antigen ligase family protein [Muricauda sp. SCSIO 65647]